MVTVRQEFVMLASQEGANIRELCRRYEVSSRTAYKWMERYRQEGIAGLVDRSRRPHASPAQTDASVEAAILQLRQQHPAWGSRKLWHTVALPTSMKPSQSTITAILRRHGALIQSESASHQPWKRFEHPAPNDLWQMDFKGHFAMSTGRCHPLTVLDDHSRFSLGVRACDNERGTTVRDCLRAIFRCYGLPDRMTMDNGSPWGDDIATVHTPLTTWLLQLGVAVSHSRPYHPQTQGKDERFHRTLKAEVLQGRLFRDLAQCQSAFDTWRQVYNQQRPHEALEMATPSTRYRSSPRAFPETLPPLEYSPGDSVRKVQPEGKIAFRGKIFHVGRGFAGHPVGLRPTTDDGIYDVFFSRHRVSRIDLSRGR